MTSCSIAHFSVNEPVSGRFVRASFLTRKIGVCVRNIMSVWSATERRHRALLPHMGILLPPASKGWGRYCFHRCLSKPGGGTPLPGFFPGHWSQVLSGGTTVLGSFPGYWSQVLSGGYPNMGYPPSQNWGTPPRTEQQSEYLLRSGRYASCVHAGLSCF